MTEIDIRQTRFGSRDASALTEAALADLSERSGGEGDSTPIDAGEFEPPAGAFLVAYVDDAPAGCAGFRTFAGDAATAELKRMYVAPGYRGLGIAKALLRAVEDAAREAGRKRLWLETGTAQPEAIGLYERCGYARIEDFGHYRGYPDVRSFGRDL